MRLTCSQKDLARALSITTKTVDVNSTLPVLNNVFLKAEGKKLHFTATNLEVAITYFIEANIENEGEITIPAKLFSSYVNYLNDNQVNIVVEGTDVQIQTKDSKTRIKGISSSEFPPIPSVEKGGTMTIKALDLKKAISQVVFAAALNTTRPILGGVYFVVEKNELKMVSTDSYRLSEKKIAVTEVTGEISCIVPAKTILELGSILDAADGEIKVKVLVSNNQVMFSMAMVQMISRLIEGQFPNYEQIIPQSSKTQIEFEVSELSLVLKRINILPRKIIIKFY